MSLVINTNIGSLTAQRSLAAANLEIRTAMERLSTGKRINSAADDPAGFAMVERMTSQIRGLKMATRNTNEALSMLAVVENAGSDITDMLQRMRELAVQAANDTVSATDRGYMQQELAALRTEIDRVATQTQYNGQTLLDGGFQNKSIQVGADQGQSISISISSMQVANLGAVNTMEAINYHASYDSSANTTLLEDYFGDDRGFGAIEVGDYVSFAQDLTKSYEIISKTAGASPGPADQVTVKGDPAGDGALVTGSTIYKNTALSNLDLTQNPSLAIASISAAIEQIAGQRAEYGAMQNRLEYTVSNLMNVTEYTMAARSRIEDADFAAESARLAKAQILQQSSTAMLSQANASAQLILSLIR